MVEHFHVDDNPLARVVLAYLRVRWAYADLQKVINEEIQDELQARAVAERLAETKFDLDSAGSLLSFLKKGGINLD